MPKQCETLADELNKLLNIRDLTSENECFQVRKPKKAIPQKKRIIFPVSNVPSKENESSSEEEMSISVSSVVHRQRRKDSRDKADESRKFDQILGKFSSDAAQRKNKDHENQINSIKRKALCPDLHNLHADKELMRMLSPKAGAKLRSKLSHSDKRNPFHGLSLKNKTFSTRQSYVGELKNTSNDNSHETLQLMYTAEQNIVSHEAEVLASLGDINGLQHLLSRYPCQLDVLFLAFTFLFLAGESSEARELLDHALFCLGNIKAHFRFSWCDSYATRVVPYSIQSNRIIFHVMSAYANALLKQSLTITGFEVLRMLWNLDPRDPMHTIFNLEYSGLKNCTFAKLLEFLHALPSSYQNMPNILYTKALCTYSIAHSTGGSEKESTVLLTNALCTFPTYVRCLYPNSWKELMPQAPNEANEHKFVEKLCLISATRNGQFWHRDHVLQWITRACESVPRNDATQKQLSRNAKLELLSSDVIDFYAEVSLESVLGKQTSIPTELLSGES